MGLKLRTLVFVVVTFPLLGFSGVLGEFAFTVLREYGVPERDAQIIARTLEEESKIVPSAVDPLMVIAFGLVESMFRNIVGDNGKAIGYFQLHEAAVIYVANFYEDVRQYKRNHRKHSELLNFPDWQTRIAYRYVYLTLKNVCKWDLLSTISAYNGRSDRYNMYVERFFRFYSELISRFARFQTEARKVDSGTARTR
uniref:Lytic transglycosylase domain-containing protein n=1 Tax=Fervidobacterium thailandense TaxID=1008305 RepID=A0A7C4GFE2_9BACT